MPCLCLHTVSHAIIAAFACILHLVNHVHKGLWYLVVSVCLSVKSHLTFGGFVRPEKTVTYTVGNRGRKICEVFSETTPLRRSSTPSIEIHTFGRPFSCRKCASHKGHEYPEMWLHLGFCTLVLSF